MAIIREKRQFGIGPIGVARVSGGVPGSNAAGTIAAAVNDSANQMADMFFRAGAREAEKAGTEQGSAVEREQIMAIDPVTGAPKAYEPPKGFGKIAQDAYQRVVMSRFQASIEEEIKLKARELAVRYDGSVDRYSAAMSEYIGAMSQNAQGQFKTYITDVGTSYLNATRSAMAIEQINRERAAAAKAQADSINAGNEIMRRMIAKDGLTFGSSGAGGSSDGSVTPVEVIAQSVSTAINDGVTAEVFSQEEYSKLSSESRFAIAAGYIEYLSSNTETAAEANLLHAAISSNDPSLISDPQLRYMLAGASYEERKDLEKVSEDFVKDRGDFLTITEQIAADDLKAEQIRRAAAINRDAAAGTNSIRYQASTYDLTAVVEVTRDNFINDMQYAAELEASGNNAEATAVTDRAKLHYDAATNGLFNRAVLNATTEEADAMERAVRSGDISFAPASKRREVAAIIALEGVSSVKDQFGSFVQSYKEDTGSALTAAEQDRNAYELSSLISETSLLVSGQPAATVNSVYDNAVSAILGSNIRSDDKNRLVKQAAAEASVAHLSPIFKGQIKPTLPQMNAMDSYLTDGVNTGILTEAQMSALDEVRKYSKQADNRSEITTRLNEYIRYTTGLIEQANEEAERKKTYSNIGKGLADPKDEKTRDAADEMFESRHGVLAGELISNPTLLNDPNNANAVNSLLAMPVMPQSAVNALKTLLNSPLEGAQVSARLSAWRNIRASASSTTGGEIFSGAVQAAFKPEEIAKLNMMDSVYTMSGGSLERVQEVSRAFDLYEGNDAYRVKVEEMLGGTLDEFVQGIEGADGLSPEDYLGITGAALGLIGASEISGESVNGIRDRLTEQIKRSAPNEGEVMNAYGGLNSSAALSITLGPNADIFRKHAISLVTSSAYTPDGEKVSRAKIADLNKLSIGRTIPGLGGFGSVSIPDDRSTAIFFRPMGPATQAGTSYTVMMWRPFGDGGPVALRQKVDLPNGQSIYPVMQVTTRDRDFQRLVENETLRRRADAKAAADARVRSDAEFAAGDYGSTPNTINLGAWVNSLFGN